ncbi:MAG: aconitate hydratase, partial [Deltaproteobacteria bacterium]|nr:aconitate hydratase [Deltaproteobacteria bacterium]
GADAAEVMAGLPWETTMPKIVGVSLRGRLHGWASAKDIIFEMLRRFTVKGGTGKIFEYFGEGARNLSATQKATITNMGAEMGATTSVFVYDETMDAYLRNVGRKEDADWVASVAEILRQDDVCKHAPERVFDEFVELDLADIEIAHAGPFSPDRITKVKDFRKIAESEKWPRNVSAVLFGSCTNSSYSDLHAAAEVLEQAGKHGLKARVPFLLSPGSEQVYETIKREGILEKLVEAGAQILAASCGPCIGQWDRNDIPRGVPNCIFTTFNRNFRGRNDANPETRAFLTSPGMAAALAVSGDVGFNPETDSILGADGETFMLNPPHPPDLPRGGLAQVKDAFVPPKIGNEDREVKIDPHSDRLALLQPFEPWDGKDFMELPILVKTKGKTTTDHISPGGKWLRYRGHLTNISKNLLEGAINAFTGKTGHGTNVMTGEKGVAFSDLAAYYKQKAGGSVIVGDENYGEGSSREHAAMSPRFLGIRAVIARSFARIHEANLKKQGILPLTFRDRGDYDKIDEDDRMSLVGLKGLAPGSPVRGIITKRDGSTHDLLLNHTLTKEQITWFKAGSALNTLRPDRKL